MSIKNSNIFRYSLFLSILLSFYACKTKEETQSTHEFTNNLISETSPYLLQHAHNPVNWNAWSTGLFENAQKANKLVVISIGYSSCHWCHVMERETFEDKEVAKLMNEDFFSIKVDREERPDVDQVYQTATQLIGRSGGWPLNVIALPDGKPLYLGTYLPKEQWIQILSRINQMYTEDPEKAKEYANGLAEGIQQVNLITPSSDFEKLKLDSLKSGVENWKQSWDLEFGGNQGVQKFMIPNSLSFLLDYAVLTKDEPTLKHVKSTLVKMANGGIFDHIAGGFYRYSTDSKWKVPHFEKMLYDNAQAISLYAAAYKVFKEPIFKEVVYNSIAFLNREMKNEKGGYYATLNAESEGEEGKFYVWSLKELESVLNQDLKLFSDYYNVALNNVWENENYILFKEGSEEDFVKKNNLSQEIFNITKEKWQIRLLQARENRVRPSTDDKILTSWNALLIKAYVDAYKTFGEESFLKNAISIFNFLKENSYNNGDLLHAYKKGSKRKEGFLEDYSFLIDAAIQLYRVTLDTQYLDFSRELTEIVQTDFTDAPSGLFTFNKEKKLISTLIKTNDGDIPSPNSVMAKNLFQLGHIGYNLDYIKKSKTMLTTLLPLVREYTDGYSNWGSLMLNVTEPFYEVVVVGENAKNIVAELHSENLPNTLIVGSASKSDALLFKDRYFEGETYIYICKNNTCKLPVTTVSAAIKQLRNF